MKKESDILYEVGDFWISKDLRGDFKVWCAGLTHSTLVATVGRNLSTGAFVRAMEEAKRRAAAR